MEEGFIKLSRKFFTNDIWQTARAYNESEAWLDLIQSARFEASEITSRIGGREITWRRGQYPASNRFLSKKWGRSENWVKKVLASFKKRGMIDTECSQGMNVITLTNFDKYNWVEKSDKNPPSNPVNDPFNTLDINALCDIIAQRLTHSETHQEINPQFSQILKPTVHPKNKKDKKDKKEKKLSPIGDNKEKQTSIYPDYQKFLDWERKNVPNVLKIQRQITEEEFVKIKAKYNTTQITDILGKIDNYKEAPRKYTSVYRTFLTWAKREYG